MSFIRWRSKGVPWTALACGLAYMLPAGFAQRDHKAGAKGDYYLYAGTYTRQTSKGIYAWRFHPADGSVQPLGLVAETSNPSFLAVAPNGRFLYAANEDSRFQGQPTGAVSAFAIDTATGKLTALNQVASKGAGPCHVSLDPEGKWLFVANYDSGSIASFPVHADGSLGDAAAFVQHDGSSVNPQRQSGPHAHSVVPSPDGRFLLAADLGLDEVLVYKIGADGSLTPNDPPFARLPPGSGPRHIAFGQMVGGGSGPDSIPQFVYVVSEMIPGVTVFRYRRQTGSLEPVQAISSLPADWMGTRSGAEIAAHGDFVYVSNRGADTIAVFRVTGRNGMLTAVNSVSTGGKTPRNFAIDPTGRWLFAANQDSDSIREFSLPLPSEGAAPTGRRLDVGSPVCVVFAAVR
jgi:6-phosphogluconolactonase